MELHRHRERVRQDEHHHHRLEAAVTHHPPQGRDARQRARRHLHRHSGGAADALGEVAVHAPHGLAEPLAQRQPLARLGLELVCALAPADLLGIPLRERALGGLDSELVLRGEVGVGHDDGVEVEDEERAEDDQHHKVERRQLRLRH